MLRKKEEIKRILSDFISDNSNGKDCCTYMIVNKYIINANKEININLNAGICTGGQTQSRIQKGEGVLPEGEREKIYRKCHGIAKQYDIYLEMRNVMLRRWKATSMLQLSDDALVSLYHLMRYMEAKIEGLRFT